MSQGTAVLGLIAGGVLAAPLGAVRPADAGARGHVLAAIAVPGLGVNNVVRAFG